MRTQVVTVTGRIPEKHREPYYHYHEWLASLRLFGFNPIIIGMNEPWWGLMTKPRRLRRWLRDRGHTPEFGGHPYKIDCLIVCDSFDVIFGAHPDQVGESYGRCHEVMFNAEKGLFPRADLAYAFPDMGTPWRYLNSGLMIGHPENILALLDAMNLDDIVDDYRAPDAEHGGPGRMIEPNDQGWYQYAYAAHPVPMTLDCKCEVFQCLSACAVDEFDFSGDKIRNKVTGTNPLVWHFNGGSKNDLMPYFLSHWGIKE